MDAFTGVCFFVAGGAMGAWIMAEIYEGTKKALVRDHKDTAKREAAERERTNRLEFRLELSEREMNEMKLSRAREESWAAGFEAGVREGMCGQTIEDVIRLTRMNNARRIKNVNE